MYYQVDWVIPANIDGLYINVETQTTGTSAGSVAGWDINPYGATNLTWFNAVGTGMMRYPGVTTGSAGNLAQKTPVSSAGSFSSGAVVFGSAPGNWVLNADNYFGFRFVGSSGQTHYGWGKMEVGASAAVRTIKEIAWESTPNAPIFVGDEGGPPPAYDPCAPFNPTLAIGSNSVNLNQDTAEDLGITGCGGQVYSANYFKFVPPVDGTYTFSTCNSGASTRMAILNGCAAGSSQLACNDNSCGSSSSVSLAMTAGSTYYVVAGAEASNATLPSPLGIDVEAPPAPTCESPVTASFGTNQISALPFAADQLVRANATTGTAVVYKALWMKFRPTTTGAYTLSLCNGTVSGVNADSKMAIAAACPGGSTVTMDSLAYNDDNCGLGSRLSSTNTGLPLTQDLVAGQDYLIVIGGYSAATAAIQGTLTIDGPPQSNCPADLDGDGTVGGLDLSALLAAWGQGSNGDVDGDNDTDGGDLTALLAAWGSNGC